MKSRKRRWAEYVTCMSEMRNILKIFITKLKGQIGRKGDDIVVYRHEDRCSGVPSVLQFCMDYETSDKSRYPTFARTRPPDTQISKSVVSVLLNFQWTQASTSPARYTYLQATLLVCVSLCCLQPREELLRMSVEVRAPIAESPHFGFTFSSPPYSVFFSVFSVLRGFGIHSNIEKRV
jgi:hypothetical protein